MRKFDSESKKYQFLINSKNADSLIMRLENCRAFLAFDDSVLMSATTSMSSDLVTPSLTTKPAA